MNYKLCKQLKKSGFPQFGDGWALVLHKKLPESEQTMDRISWRDFIMNPEKDFVYAPNLEELIEWCGDDFQALVNWGVIEGEDCRWEANGWETTEHNDTISFVSLTPSIAVAKLGLKLHEKHISTRPQN